MSALIENDPLNPNGESLTPPDDVDIPIELNLEEYVNTPEFDHQCSQKARERAALSSDQSSDPDEDGLWSSDDSVSSATTIESTPYKVPKIEANSYCAGVGSKGRGPKLIYRTSDDKFEEPHGPEAYTRFMRVVAVPENHEFGQNGMWDTVRDQVVELLNQKNIKFSSVDFIRFTWLNKKADQEIEEEDDNDDAQEEGDQ